MGTRNPKANHRLDVAKTLRIMGIHNITPNLNCFVRKISGCHQEYESAFFLRDHRDQLPSLKQKKHFFQPILRPQKTKEVLFVPSSFLGAIGVFFFFFSGGSKFPYTNVVCLFVFSPDFSKKAGVRKDFLGLKKRGGVKK